MLSRVVAVIASSAVIAAAGVPGAAAADHSPPAELSSALTSSVNNARWVGPGKNTGIVSLADGSAKAKIPGDGPIVVSLGDSYISGEAGRWAGNVVNNKLARRTDALKDDAYNDGGKGELIPGCHRAKGAEIHFGAKNTTSVNLACSGAITTSDYTAKTDVWKPGIDSAAVDFGNGVTGLGQTALLANLVAANPGRVRMVNLSIGGNDFNFGPIVGQCVKAFLGLADFSGPCSKAPSVTQNFSDANVATQQTGISKAIQRVVGAVGTKGMKDWTLMVQDYPSPVAPTAQNRYGENSNRLQLGGCPMLNADLDWANNTALTTINRSVQAAIGQARTALPEDTRIKFLELQDTFVGHRLCEKNNWPLDFWWSPVWHWDEKGAVNSSEWVQSVRILGQVTNEVLIYPFRTQESLHPDYWGQQAYQSCLSQAFAAEPVAGGQCLQAGTGLDAAGRPVMKLTRLESYAPSPSSKGPSKVTKLRAKRFNAKAEMIRWNKPAERAKGAMYRYRLKGPKATKFSGWRSLGKSTSVMLGVHTKGKYRVKVVAQNRHGFGTVTGITFRR